MSFPAFGMDGIRMGSGWDSDGPIDGMGQILAGRLINSDEFHVCLKNFKERKRERTEKTTMMTNDTAESNLHNCQFLNDNLPVDSAQIPLSLSLSFPFLFLGFLSICDC